MVSGEIICGSCGWRNESTARMCGGCGRPLRATGVPAGAGGRVADTVSARLAVDDDAPTVPDIPLADIPAPARPRGTPAAPYASPPTPRRAAAPGMGGASRALLIVGAALAIVVALCAGGWGLALRPALHAQVDSALRAQLDGLVAQVNQQQGLQFLPASTVKVPAQEVTRSIQSATPTNSPVQNVKVSFSGGRITVSFTSFGGGGALSTILTAKDGRLSASGTRVDGALALVESWDEAQRTMNEALGNLRSDVVITQLTTDGDQLTIGIKGTNAPTPGGVTPQQ